MMRWYEQTNKAITPLVGALYLYVYRCDLYAGTHSFSCNGLNISSDVLQGKAKEKSILCVCGL